ncbi:MAG TPA: hypothetical protein VNO75_08705, partial [Gemmatimonadaceae bacterium]|nr:hypothetical protein [Gemmatimonadaceae bacterium]
IARVTEPPHVVPHDALVVALILTGAYILIPAMLVWIVDIERALKWFQKASVIGPALSSGALAYFFSRY